MIRPFSPYAKIKPKSDTLYTSQGRTVLATDRDGFLHNGADHGFFSFETRFLSKYQMLVNGSPLHPNVLSNVEAHSWLGYYTFLDENWLSDDEKSQDGGSGQMNQESEKTLELKLSRYVGGGMHEDIDFTNYTGKRIEFEFKILIDADFADQKETGRARKQQGKKETFWEEVKTGRVLKYDYQAKRSVEVQDFKGKGKVHRGIDVLFKNYTSPPQRKGEEIIFEVALPPFGKWHCCVDHILHLEFIKQKLQYQCHSFEKVKSEYDSLRTNFLNNSTSIGDPFTSYLSPVVVSSFEQAKKDLASMRLYDLDSNDDSWTMAAGLPIYTAFFGRDTLTASWQSGLIGPEMMKGTLNFLKDNQSKKIVNWFDEDPGRLLHEQHSGPLSKLYFNNHSRNYGSVTTTHLFPFIVSELWRWTGNKGEIEQYIEPALRSFKWMEDYEIKDKNGFYFYKTKSLDGVKNQGWKDSPQGVVDQDGKQLDPPIAMCEEQAFIYVSKFAFSELLWSVGRKAEAKKLFHEAQELKKRFNEVFWLEDLQTFAMGLDKEFNPIKVVGSDPGHCIAAGIIDKSLVTPTADRLFQNDLFSGWGIRTLSNKNPAFNPYSYHRGSVWPVESGTFSLGFMRYGLFDHLHKLSRSFFDLVSLYEFNRLPEVLSGHPRDTDHPIPALYPQANSPQAWSASATVNVLQALLGIYPYAPRNILLINPNLPEWLPQIQVNGIRVGEASMSILFYRKENGKSDYKIIEQRGELRVVRQPSPWSLTSSVGERLGDFIESFMH
jgi:glycogen debranching enzyme